MNAIKEYIGSCKRELEPFIESYLANLAESRGISGVFDGREKLAKLYEIFTEAGRGGKCIRGSLVKLGYEIALGRPDEERGKILPACAAFEVLQTAILGHDDVIDRSPLRRGRDSIWQAIAQQAVEGGEDEARHYGISQAICLGDVGISIANRLIADSSFSAERKIEAMKTFLDVQLNTVDGEMLDVLVSYEKDYGDERAILDIFTLKTAWYTVAGPLRLGASLGGASAGLMEAMRRYGILLGTAFQIRDDILGINADEADTGKSNTSDIAEGKVTLLACHAMKNAAPDQMAELRRVYGSGSVSESDHLIVREIFESTGAFAEASRKAGACLTEARGMIGDLTKDPAQAGLLTQLGELMAQRKS